MRVPPNTGQYTAPAPAATSVRPASTQETPESMLFEAIRNADLQEFTYILENLEVDPAARNEDGQTPLHQAIEQGHDEMSRMLIEISKLDFLGRMINAEDSQGYTPAMRAAEKDNAAMLRAILEVGGDYPERLLDDDNAAPIIAKVKMLQTPLLPLGFAMVFSNAVSFEPLETVKFLFDAATPSERDEQIKRNLRYGGTYAATTMIQLGADTAGVLEELAQNQDAAGVHHMQSWGADMTTPLVSFAQRGMTQAIQTFLAARVDPLQAVEQLLKSKDIPAIECLMRAGMPTVPLLMEFARQHEREKARTLINLEADVATAINTLIQNGEQDAANFLAVAMAAALLPEQPKADSAPQ